MDAYLITGGNRLSGVVHASGAKNAVLPILAASILASRPVELAGIPQVADVDTMSLLLGHLGVEVTYLGAGRLCIETVDPAPTCANAELVRRMRASFCVLGPLLARRGRAVIALPGGCKLGTRPIDLHLRGLAALGAEFRVQGGYVTARAKRLRGTTLDLCGPCGPTVTGTANVLSAATLAAGKTILHHAASEPEIVDLGELLIRLGARIKGLGTPTLEIDGVAELGGACHRIIPDRIEAATWLIAAAITGGSIQVQDIMPEHLTAVLAALAEMGCQVQIGRDWISLRGSEPLQPIELATAPYPGLPTDVQAQFTALLSTVMGRSMVTEGVFPKRLGHVSQLRRLGADLQTNGNRIRIDGVPRLQGNTLTASDLRAAAALVLAGLASHGQTLVRRIDHLDRGYEQFEQKLRRLGAQIERVSRVESRELRV